MQRNVRRETPVAPPSTSRPTRPAIATREKTTRATTASLARPSPKLPPSTRLSRLLDEQLASAIAQSDSEWGPPLLSQGHLRGSEPYEDALANRLQHSIDDATVNLESVFRRLDAAAPVELGQLSAVAMEIMQELVKDLDLFVSLGIDLPEGSYLHQHCVHVAMLAMAVAANMNYGPRAIMDLGVGCLLHDVGMLRVPGRVYEQERELSSDEFDLVVVHPIHTLTLLEEHFELFTMNARMVAYQMHERCDGTGYPRGLKAGMIHPLARIAAVADAYVALVSVRPHRPGLLPYHALRHLLGEVQQGLYDARVVRSLLKTLSLFPLGSFVKLNDDRMGRVIRANGANFDRPVIEIVDATGVPSGRGLIDLCRISALRVVSAVDRPMVPG
jgi:HD-GYP domain-containing protein (c-di-GMP phosphodiesterase class II)